MQFHLVSIAWSFVRSNFKCGGDHNLNTYGSGWLSSTHASSTRINDDDRLVEGTYSPVAYFPEALHNS